MHAMPLVRGGVIWPWSPRRAVCVRAGLSVAKGIGRLIKKKSAVEGQPGQETKNDCTNIAEAGAGRGG
jgi:hypothetical protein